MTFYTSIADLYDEIFPCKPPQKAFVESFKMHGPESVILDVGCGTGGLALNLAESFGTVIGIDPDKEMLEKANLKALKFKFDHRDTIEDLGNWVFLQKGMGDLKNEFAEDSCDVILCFGNTLVHLPTQDDVQSFLNDTFLTLKPEGKLMIQIINYDRIIDNNLKGLQTIETENLKFERLYHYEPNPVSVKFNTILTIKESGKKIENEVPLLALKPNELKKMMTKAGFKDLQEFGNFKKEEFNPNSQPYIVVGGK